MNKNLIKILLMLQITPLWASSAYKIGYFDQEKSKDIGEEVIKKWWKTGLSLGNPKNTTRIHVLGLDVDAKDEALKGIDILVTRAQLDETKKIAMRYERLGGKFLISDRWTTEDLKLNDLAVFSVAMPSEKKTIPALKWINKKTLENKKKPTFLSMPDSDFDKIWLYELQNHPLSKNLMWAEVSHSSKKNTIDYKKIKLHESLLVLNRLNLAGIKLLTASKNPTEIFVAEDPEPHDELNQLLKQNISLSYMSLYAKDLSEHSREFAREFPTASSSDATLRDSLVFFAKVASTTNTSATTKSSFFKSLANQSFHGVTGMMQVKNGHLLREVFVITQRGSDRFLNWSSGVEP